MFLQNLRLFLLIVERGSLAAAAREAGLSTTAVSERLRAMEAHFGVVLFNRTTRSLSLTDEGRLLVHGAKVILGEVSELEARIRHGAETLSGPIRLSAPVDLGQDIVAQVVADFTAENPDVTIELALSDGYVDLVGQGFDLAIRFGAIGASSLRARTLGHFRRLVCAAPSYLEDRGRPTSPEDLADHTCLVMRFGGGLDAHWNFMSDAGPYQVAVSGPLSVNDGALIRRWALEGRGIVLKSELDVASDIAAGRLVSLLEEHLPAANPLQLIFPPGRAQPKRVTALAENLRQALTT